MAILPAISYRTLNINRAFRRAANNHPEANGVDLHMPIEIMEIFS